MKTGRLILGLASLLWGFVQAPFDHIHPDEELEHQVTSAPMHVHGHEPYQEQGAAIASRTADDDEVDVPWGITTTPHVTVPVGAVLVSRLSLPEPETAAAPSQTPRHRGHDPPAFQPTAPRAPPA